MRPRLFIAITVTVWAVLLQAPCLTPAPAPPCSAPGGSGGGTGVRGSGHGGGEAQTPGFGGGSYQDTSADSRESRAGPPGNESAHMNPEMSSSDPLHSNTQLLRRKRSSLTRSSSEHVLLQVQTGPELSQFGVKFHKCAQLVPGSDPPLISILLLIHHVGPSHGSNLTQVAVRDSISGLAPVRSEVRSLGWSEGREVEAGYQSFAIDSLYAGSQVVLNYSAHIRSPKTGVLELPAYLTFSNASQNDVNMFGPLTANLTLRVNSTVRMFPHPTLHFAGFLGGFLVSLALVLLGFLFLNCVDPGTALRLCPKQRHGAASDLEFDTSEVSNGLKQEAEFEDKIVDIMTLEEPQDMQHALDSLETSSLLRASAQLEASRLQMHRDLVVALLSQGAGSGVTLVEVLLGQIMALEGRLQEEHQDKMAALTEHFNQEMRDTMNAINTQLLRDTEEREEAERKSRDTETALHCRTLQEKFHKLKERWVQHHLLVRQEEVSARVQREVAERRREVVHQIFCEELEEATRTGDMDQSSASTLQHLYFNCQDFLEQVWDEVVAHQKAILSERQTHRKLLVQSLQGVHSLVSETFCNNNSRRGGPGGELQALYDRGQQEVLVQRQRLQETVKQEKAALRCDLLQKRRDKLSNMWHLHRQQQNSLSSIPLSSLSSPSSLSSSSPLPPVEFMLLLQSWRDLLVFQSREESELIKHLDQEAATCIKKVVSDLLKGTTTELRELHTPVLLQTERPLQHTEEAAVAQESRGCTTEEPQGALQRELGEQRDIREQCRIFFRRLLSSQLSLSDSDLLKLKLEYQKCFSVMDRCLVVPPAVLRAKVQRGLEEWRRSQEKLMSRGKRKSTKEESELRRFKKNLQERLKLYEQSHKKEMELREEMEQQMRSDSQAPLLSLSERLSSLLVSLHLDKVQSWSQVLQTWEAILCLQSLLIPELRERPEMATEIRAHREGLAAAEEEFQQDLCRVDIDLAPPVDTDPLTTLSSVSPPPPIPPLLEDGVLEVKPDCNMGSILQEALYKREQLLSLLSQKSEESTSRTQIREDLRQHLELRRLQQLCAQDVKFTSVLVRLLEVPRDVLMQMLCVLLPALPERELLSLCESLSPKDLPQCPRLSSLNHLIVKLRADFTREASLDAPVCTGQTDRMEEKRRGLLEKLLSSVCAPPPSATPLILVQPEIGTRSETGPEIGTRPGSDFLKLCLVKPDPDEYMCLSRASPDLDPGPCPSTVLSSDAHAVHSERLFIFRDVPVSAQTPEGAIRKRRKNFLNLKKSSVAPLISDS